MYTKEIKSLQHPIVKHLVKLRKERRYRLEKESLLLEGKKMIFEYCGPIKILLTTKDAPIPNHLHPKTTLFVSFEIIEKISGTKAPEPYLAEVPLPSSSTLEGKERLLALDGISDPGNVGTLIRTALALGFDGIFLTKNSADPFMDKALRAAKGATFHLPIQMGTEEELIALIKKNGLIPYIADGNGSTKTALTSPLILILGNEANGPSQTLKKLGQLIAIPIVKETESLNVAVAGGILMNKFQEILWPR
ncbi:MAG: RNA methyltransferase [Simkaniaceae bacterium]|jgi:TrmH family RNA methyltransferase|nr:MAG: RNA methyltransferase [Simkaniaceae bacterium]